MSTDIPRARYLLQAVLDNCALSRGARADIEEALTLMTRPPLTARRQTRVKSKAIDANMVSQIRQLAEDPRRFSQQEIAVMLGTNAGRVSEVLTGRRDDSGELVR